MPTTLTALTCSATTSSITIRFSEPVDSSTLQLSNLSVYDPPKFATPSSLDATWSSTPIVSRDSLSLTFTSSNASFFNPGDYVLVTISGVPGLPLTDLTAQVPFPGGTGRAVRDVEDAISYPILTEEISNRPYPVSTVPSAGGSGGGGGGSASLGQLASRTVTDVLGWKVNSADPKGFIGALTQAFTLTDVEGHVEASWNPQMPAIQTDLGGSITGAQASLYMRAKEAVDQSSSLLDTLYPLDPEADPEYVKALREMVRSQMTQIVRELAVIGLPSVLRIDTYFGILLDQNPALIGPGDITFNPDAVGGTLGKLRDTYGIQFANNRFNNSVADEVVITNFRVISDYLTSLMQSWISNREFFFVQSDKPAFFGTQLVLISRQFNVIAETVNELRFALDSVFIGPAERQALLLEFADPALPPRFLESMLIEIEAFVGDEGPRLLKEGGKITVTNNILPVVNALLNMVEEAHTPTNVDELPDGFRTARVRNSLDDLQDQLERLSGLVQQVEQQVPAPEDQLSVSCIDAGLDPSNSDEWIITVLGDGFEPGITATLQFGSVDTDEGVDFFSAQRFDITGVLLGDFGTNFGGYDLLLANPDGTSITVTHALDITPNGITAASQFSCNSNGSGFAGASARKKSAQRARGRNVAINMGGRQGPIATAPPPRPAQPAPAPGAAEVASRVQDLHAAHVELGKKVEAQAQHLAGIHEKIDTMFEHIKSLLGGHGTTTEQNPDQPKS